MTKPYLLSATCFTISSFVEIKISGLWHMIWKKDAKHIAQITFLFQNVYTCLIHVHVFNSYKEMIKTLITTITTAVNLKKLSMIIKKKYKKSIVYVLLLLSYWAHHKLGSVYMQGQNIRLTMTLHQFRKLEEISCLLISRKQICNNSQAHF